MTHMPLTETRRWLRPAAVRLVLLLVVFFALDLVSGAILQPLAGIPVLRLILGVAIGALALWLYSLAVRYTEHRAVTELNRKAAVDELGRGMLIGLVLFAAVILLIAMFGGYRITGWGSFGGLLVSLGMMAAAATIEELLFRGSMFRLVEEMTGTWGALAISAVFFGGVHLLNPGATFWGALAIAVEAGLMLGAAYVATRSLWLPIGIHLAWNVAEGGIFGTDVSGTAHGPAGLLQASMPGPDILTGGGFGPEASIFAILISAIPTILFLRAAARNGRIHRRGQRV